MKKLSLWIIFFLVIWFTNWQFAKNAVDLWPELGAHPDDFSGGGEGSKRQSVDFWCSDQTKDYYFQKECRWDYYELKTIELEKNKKSCEIMKTSKPTTERKVILYPELPSSIIEVQRFNGEEENWNQIPKELRERYVKLIKKWGNFGFSQTIIDARFVYDRCEDSKKSNSRLFRKLLITIIFLSLLWLIYKFYLKK